MKYTTLLVEDCGGFVSEVKMHLKTNLSHDKFVCILAKSFPDCRAMINMYLEELNCICIRVNDPNNTVWELVKELRCRSTARIYVWFPSVPEDEAMWIYHFGADALFYNDSVLHMVEQIKADYRRQTVYMKLNAQESNFHKRKQPKTLYIQGFKINPHNGSVTRGDVNISLTVREFDMLYYLASRPGIVCTEIDILCNVWGYDYPLGSDLSCRISRLRKKIEENPHDPKYIITKRGRGYYMQSDKLDD